MLVDLLSHIRSIEVQTAVVIYTITTGLDSTSVSRVVSARLGFNRLLGHSHIRFPTVLESFHVLVAFNSVATALGMNIKFIYTGLKQLGIQNRKSFILNRAVRVHYLYVTV